MTSKQTLSSDLDLVKEIEQLRIKQKLLISALEKKNSQEKSQELQDLSAKIDFLVEIFKDASSEESKNDKEEEESDEEAESEATPVIDKLEEISSNFEKRFDELEKKIANMQKASQEETQKEQEAKKDSNPPLPDFQGGADNKEAKKKGLFSSK